MQVKGKDLRIGDVMEVWWRPHRDTIVELVPYTEPFPFTCAIAKFVHVNGMTIETERLYEVVIRPSSSTDTP